MKEANKDNSNDFGNTFDRRLLNEFWLNEIRLKDDALKQMISINALLMGAYATVLFNNQDRYNIGSSIIDLLRPLALYKLSLLGIDLKIINIIVVTILFLIAVIVILLIIVGPVFFWYLSINSAMSSFLTIYRDAEYELLDPEASSEYLLKIAQVKNNKYHNAYQYTIIGITIVVFIVFINALIGIFSTI